MSVPDYAQLRRDIRGAYAWTFAGNLLKQTFFFAISVLLARFVGPSDYGLMGMAMVLVAILSVVNETLGQSVVYLRNSEDSLPTHFTVPLAIGAALTLVCLPAAPLAAMLYRRPELTVMVVCLAATILLGGLRAGAQNLLLKRFAFRELNLMEAAASLFAGVVAVWMAWAGYGVWSLIANLLLIALLQTGWLLWTVRPQWTLSPDRAEARRILAWGLPMLGSSILWRFYDNADYFIVGRMLGAEALGFYTMAFRLATLVNDKIGAVVNRVTVPSFSALQQGRDQLAAHWLSVSHKLALICFPILAMLAVNAEDVVAVLLGVKWRASVEPVRFLCVVGLLRLLTPVTNNLLAALGKTGFVFQYTLLLTLLLPPGFYIGCSWAGVRGVGLAWILLYPPIVCFQVRRALQELGMPARTYLTALQLPLLAGLPSLAAMLALSAGLPPGIVRLIASCLLGGAIYVAGILIGSAEYRSLTVRGLVSLRSRG